MTFILKCEATLELAMLVREAFQKAKEYIVNLALFCLGPLQDSFQNHQINSSPAHSNYQYILTSLV